MRSLVNTPLGSSLIAVEDEYPQPQEFKPRLNIKKISNNKLDTELNANFNKTV